MKKAIPWNDAIDGGVAATPLLLTWYWRWQAGLTHQSPWPTVQLALLALVGGWLVWLALKWWRRHHLADLPWYLVLSLSDAGKETLCQQSGLRELPPTLGPVKALDPTLAAKTVVLAGAGVYVMHKLEENDRALWVDLLGRLKKCLRGLPMSGVLIVVNADEVLAKAVDEQKAQRVVERLHDLTTQLGVRPPVYLVTARSDQLPGFLPYFGALSHEERTQAWGATFTAKQQEDPAGAFATESQLLYRALDTRRLARLAAVDAAERNAVYEFPLAFQQLCYHLRGFVEELCRVPTAYEGLPLRGFYFTGIAQPAGAELRHSYFCTGLFSYVFWRDQGVTQPTVRADRRLWFKRMALTGGAYALAAASLVGWPNENPIPPAVTPVAPTTPAIVATVTEATLTPSVTVSPTVTVEPVAPPITAPLIMTITPTPTDEARIVPTIAPVLNQGTE